MPILHGGGGAGVGGAGTGDYLAKWTPAGSDIEDSILHDDGSAVTSDGNVYADGTGSSYLYPRTFGFINAHSTGLASRFALNYADGFPWSALQSGYYTGTSLYAYSGVYILGNTQYPSSISPYAYGGAGDDPCLTAQGVTTYAPVLRAAGTIGQSGNLFECTDYYLDLYFKVTPEGDAWLARHFTVEGQAKKRLGDLDQILVGTIFTQTANATVANTATKTTLVGSGVGTITLPADFLAAGRTIRLRAAGYLSTAATTDQTLTITFELGGVELLATAAIPMDGTESGQPWSIDVFFTCRTTGGSGTVYPQSFGGFLLPTISTSGGPESMWATSAVTVDTTADNDVEIKAEWDSADAGDSVTCTNLTIEILN